MNTGDGMTMASAIGAALYEDPWVIPNVIMPTRTLTKADAGFKKLCDMILLRYAPPGISPICAYSFAPSI